MNKFWTEEEFKRLDIVGSMKEAVVIALSVLARMSKTGREIVQICGPISTGGLGSPSANLALFELAIRRAKEKGLLVHDQLPYQKVIERLFKESKDYRYEILDDFYAPVFKSGLIHRTMFIEKWQTSTGSRWERDLVSRLGIRIEEYPMEWLRDPNS